jgi:hypothetical protein
MPAAACISDGHGTLASTPSPKAVSMLDSRLFVRVVFVFFQSSINSGVRNFCVN